MLRGVINHPSQGIFITTFCKVVGEDGVKREPTMEEMQAEMARVVSPMLEELYPQGITELPVYFVDEAIIPTDEVGLAFYDALIYQPATNSFEYNLPKARTMRVEQLRNLRRDLFPLVDAMRAKALETGNQEDLDNVADIANKLRDMPADALAALESHGDIGAIASYIPDVFGRLVAK